MARPELLDSRPTWPAALRLEPLGSQDAASLIGTAVGEELCAKITAAAAGNPLFISEMLAMAGEGGDEVAVPPTLQALLAARLDQLDAAERRVLEREVPIWKRPGKDAVAVVAEEDDAAERMVGRSVGPVDREPVDNRPCGCEPGCRGDRRKKANPPRRPTARIGRWIVHAARPRDHLVSYGSVGWVALGAGGIV
jgi:hypothetical protein